MLSAFLLFVLVSLVTCHPEVERFGSDRNSVESAGNGGIERDLAASLEDPDRGSTSETAKRDPNRSPEITVSEDIPEDSTHEPATTQATAEMKARAGMEELWVQHHLKDMRPKDLYKELLKETQVSPFFLWLRFLI